MEAIGYSDKYIYPPEITAGEFDKSGNGNVPLLFLLSDKKYRGFVWMFEENFILLHRNSMKCPDGGIGRRAGLKHQWSKIHPGSTPGLGTMKG